MATIYLSSTYNDLKAYREEAYRALRQSRQEVIAMEDYVASDLRPVDLCLRDVEKADIYVGLFAFRYGYVPLPEHNNPHRLSITEIEFRHARANNKPCLIFLLVEEKKKNWPAEFIDAHTGDDKGKRIDALRANLSTQQVVSFFSTPEKLATQVLAALMSNEVTKGLIASRALDHDLPPIVTWDIATQGPPYPGLLSFSRKYAPVFFGRELEVRALLDRLHDPEGRFLIVSGDSGVGKSSLVEAGVIPKLEAGRLPGWQTGLCVRMPASQGDRPFPALMKLVQPIAQQSGLMPQEIEEITRELERSPQSLSGHLRTLTKRGTDGKALVLFLDQLEEWFPKDEPTQPFAFQDFLSAVYQAAQEGVLWVLATIRSDHLHRCHHHSAMRTLLGGRSHYLLGPIQRYMLRDMIRKPANCAGLTITDQLVSILSDEMMNNPGSLPLLAFVLQELCEQRTPKGELSEAVYEKFNRLTGAIAKHAAKVEAKVQQQLGRNATALWPTLFRSLVVVDADGLPTRRRLPQTDLNLEQAKLVKVLIDERLLYSEKEGGTVSLSHEKLLEAWPALQRYVTTNKKQLLDHTLLKVRAQQWETAGKSRLRGLASAREAKDFQRAEVTRTPMTDEYLQVSHQFRTWRNWIVGLLGFICTILGGYASLDQWVQAQGHEGLESGMVAKFLLTRVGHRVGIDLLSPPMVRIETGSAFIMGNARREADEHEQPAHPVKFSRLFAIGQYEVTFREYDLFTWVTGKTKDKKFASDEDGGRGQRSVINVSWEDATAYAQWLSQQTGKGYRLPTESEWEYAARSAGKNPSWAGAKDEGQLKYYAVYDKEHTEVVGSKKPNGLDLYDMGGNVLEWLEDCWHENYEGAPEDGSAWLEAKRGDCGRRVVRDGYCYDRPEFLRPSHRCGADAGNRNSLTGFRLAQDIEP